MYLTVIAWIYVVLLMSIAEATSTTGTVLGALMTFLLYGLLPLAIVMYVIGTPSRRRAIKAREIQAREAVTAPAEPAPPSASNQPETSGHSARAPDATGSPMPAAPVREKP